ncbi:RNA polymerase sigma factor [Roseivirga thermotolerans]|uniref:RNA polymerase sigma factor n=1 Tax=Roseivirga thermotolerans TaxID=1758176 RepID=A0ABQ3I943_9BACT|nr:sigma-70 family RNA polymerase sigma factor [Roseivirga thermotolerans]GHE73310.1 RNA polymerase sigma factor [Roseivirga thermotolerans]
MDFSQAKHSCDEFIYNALFRSIAPLLRNFLYARYKDVEKANDMVQEAFLALWKNCSNVLPAMAKAYVFRVAQNQMLKSIDKEKTKDKHIHFIQKSTNYETPHYQLEFSEFDRKVQAAITSLPEGQREVFLMNRIEKLTYTEIAELLEVSVKAVEKRMHKALQKLRADIHENI